MIQKLTIIKKRNSFWIHGWTDPKGSDRFHCTSYNLYKTICDTYNIRWKKYQSTLELYDKSQKLLKLPLGYGIDKITKHLEESNHDIVYKIEDHSMECIDYDLIDCKLRDGFAPRNDIQRDAINFLLSCKDGEYVEGKGYQLFLTLLTGGGKTFCAIYSAIKLRLPTIIISYNLSEQWKEKLLEYVELEEKDIYEIKGKDSILNLFEDEKTYPFYIASISTLRVLMEHYKNLNILLSKMRVGLTIFDEAHMHYKSISQILVNSDTRFTFFLSATPNRSNYTENKVFLNLFDKVPMHGIYTHNLNNHSKIRFIKYNTYPTQQERRFCETSRGFSAINYYKYLFSSEEKTLLIVGMIKYFADQILNLHPDKKILVFIPTLDFMHYVYKFLKKYRLNYTIGEYNSNVYSVDKREKELDKNLILTTIAACSTGKDIPNLKAIFSLTPFSSPVITRQILGRLRKLEDSDSYFYDFTDTGFAKCSSQCNIRTQLLKQLSSSMTTKTIESEDMILYLKENL